MNKNYPTFMIYGKHGLAKREYFAANAIMGIRASEKEGPRYGSWQVAEMARKDADVLLAELAKEV